MSDDMEIKDLLKEILKWTKFEGMQKIKQVLENTLDSDPKKLVYESSNGLSSPEVAKIAGVDDSTVRDYWKDWAILGIAEIHPNFKKRYRRIFSLEEVGIEVPNPKGASELKEIKNQETSEGEENE